MSRRRRTSIPAPRLQDRGDALATFRAVMQQTSHLTQAEIYGTITPLRHCFRRMREGVATDDEFAVVYTALLIAEGIEQSGVIRGLDGHIHSAIEAAKAIELRASLSGQWKPTAMYWYEIEAIDTMIDLHVEQLKVCTAGEIRAVTRKLISRTLSSGGSVRTVPAGVLEVSP